MKKKIFNRLNKNAKSKIQINLLLFLKRKNNNFFNFQMMNHMKTKIQVIKGKIYYYKSLKRCLIINFTY